MKNKVLTNSLLWAWLVLCIGAIFTHSSSFTDFYILPKWLVVIALVLCLGAYGTMRLIINKPVRIDFPALGIGMSVLCCIQAIYGLLQYFSLVHSDFGYKITGTFDNPAGFAACLCCGLPFVAFFLLHHNRYMRYAGWAISALIIVAVYLSHSRSGIVSVLVIIIVYVCGKYIHGRVTKPLLAVVLAGLVVASCYWIKKDSADGRLLIWQCGWEMVKDAPFFGHGIGSFDAHYMDYQADYFKEQGLENRYAMLADNVKQPFNEYLGVLINWGIAGLLLLVGIVGVLVYCYRQNPTMEKRIALYALLSIGVFSCFSYPFTYPFTWLVTFLAVLMLTSDYWNKIKIPVWCRNIIYMAAMLGAFIGMNKVRDRFQMERNWQEASVLALCNDYDEAIVYYVTLLHKFEDNPYFLYNYAAVLVENKQYEKSLKIALQCRQYWADYDLELIIGENYQYLGKQELAQMYYKNASMMCPSRFLPLYKLFHLYKENKEHDKMREIAELIIRKPMKIKTSSILMMKREMKRELRKLEERIFDENL